MTQNDSCLDSCLDRVENKFNKCAVRVGKCFGIGDLIHNSILDDDDD